MTGHTVVAAAAAAAATPAAPAVAVVVLLFVTAALAALLLRRLSYDQAILHERPPISKKCVRMHMCIYVHTAASCVPPTGPQRVELCCAHEGTLFMVDACKVYPTSKKT